MKVCLAGGCYNSAVLEDRKKHGIKNVPTLDSFVYYNTVTERLRQDTDFFMLDSGVYTYMNGKDPYSVDWEDYAERLGAWVKDKGIKLYFEIDIDRFFGYKKVKELRKRLERAAGIPPIPVWHNTLTKRDYQDMCGTYPYVALGGLVTARKSGKLWSRYRQAFPWFVREAHRQGARVHGLGCTHMSVIQSVPFDSVDSTSWVQTTISGSVARFNGTTVVSKNPRRGAKVTDWKKLAIINNREWVKFCRYADANY